MCLDSRGYATAKDEDGDGVFPILGDDGVWVDGDGEADNGRGSLILSS